MDRPTKPSLSQQLLRTLRPRAVSSTTTASSLVTSSATASPSISALDSTSTVSTPDVAFDVLFAKTSGPYSQRALNASQASQSTAQGSNSASVTSSPQHKGTDKDDVVSAISSKPASSLTRADYLTLIHELHKTLDNSPVPTTLHEAAIPPSPKPHEDDATLQRDMQCLRVLIAALKRTADAEQAAIDEGAEWDEARILQQGPPQSDVFKLCLLLLNKANECQLPLPIRLGACEMLAVSVQLSDMRAARAIKAVRETRSGAPGSQSNRAIDADQPLANIDRAALYALVRDISSHAEGGMPTKDNQYETRLPALPMQLRALDVLSQEGRDVVSFPGILDFLSDALETVWQELQVLRSFASSTSDTAEQQSRERMETHNAEQMALTEQLSIREWSFLSILSLIASIMKFSFAKLDIKHIEYMLECLTHAMCYAPPQVSGDPTEVVQPRRRARSKEKRALVDGYDYYGLDSIASNSPTPIATPKAGQTPRIGPRFVNESVSAVAPIALATVAPTALATTGQQAASTLGVPILHDTEISAVCKLVDSVLRFGFMPPASVDDVCRLLCAILGHRTGVTTAAEGAASGGSDDGLAWSKLVKPVVANLLRSHCANAALRSVLGMLIDRQPDESIDLVCGAVDFLRCALLIASGDDAQSSSTKAGDDALKPTLSVPLLMPALIGALKRHNDVLDIRVLDLVAELLPLTGSQQSLGGGLDLDDWEMLLSLPATAKRHLQDWQFKYGNSPLSSSSPQSKLPGVVIAMARLTDQLRLARPTAADESEAFQSKQMPWTPRLAALFLSLAPILPEAKARMLVEYYKVSNLCLPCTPNWLTNIEALVGAFFTNTVLARSIAAALPHTDTEQSSTDTARRAVAHLVFDHVYGTVHNLPAYRNILLQKILLPLATSSLAAESDRDIELMLRRVIVEAAVTTATNARAITDTAVEDETDEHGRIFADIVSLHTQLAQNKKTSPVSQAPRDKGTETGAHIKFAVPPGSHEHKPSLHSHSRSSSVAAVIGPLASSESKQVNRERAVRSIVDLITIFDRLAFSSPWVLLNTSSKMRESEEAQRAAWERQARNACLWIFRTLLGMMQPAEPSELPEMLAPTRLYCLEVRLTILQWLVRMRTDGEHRVYIASDMSDLVGPSATSIGRGPISESDVTASEAHAADAVMTDRSRPRGTAQPPVAGRDDARDGGRVSTAAERSASRARETSRDRGRRDTSADRSDRYRSQSRQRPVAPPPTKKAYVGEPLWRIPEKLAFDIPPVGWRSDVVFTYMHTGAEGENECHHDHHHAMPRSGDNPVPLPISEYLAVCVALLTREHEWELVSYLLCHLPHQLANKHLVCGPKAQVQIVALRQVLVSNILEQRFLNQVMLPDEIKKSDVYALSYSTLATLVSYRSLFTRTQQDEIVEAFMAGLNKSSNTAQPCIRALSIACYELQKSINRHLPKMLVRLSTVMSSSAMSVHILELIASIGNLPSLYANFTETEFRRIFGIALQYIQYHHQRHSEEDTKAGATAFTLSQYVIMLAYYNLSLWYIIVKRADRPNYVDSIRKGLLIANEGRTKIADQTEVCFDFLARFTHSNADARPQKSYLNHIVGAKGTSVNSGGSADKSAAAVAKHYLQGNALLSVTMLDKQGWAEVLVRRPSGTTGMLCKLENVVMPQLPEEDSEHLERPAAYMMNRSTEVGQSTVVPSAWARHSLAEHADSLGRRPLGPALPEQKSRARSQSATFADGTLAPAKFLRRVEPDAYSTLTDVDENGRVLQAGSLELQETMRKVLSEGKDNAPDAKGSDGKAHDASDKNKTPAITARHEAIFDPGFIALQLSTFPDTTIGRRDLPLLLPDEKWVERTIRAIDLTPVVDFHKIGVLYVGAGQSAEQEILGNRTGSRRYAQFLTGLGDLVTLRGQQDVYTGGLDINNDEHGKYAYVWGDEISQIVFHTTTLMPNDEERDPNHSRKKALIGNDWVRIVWNESGREYDFDTIKTQFNFINIVISPNSRGGVELGSINSADDIFYRVSLQRIEGLPSFSPIGDGQLVSAAALANFIRILALNCSLVSQIYVNTSGRDAGQSTFTYTSNWVSRLQHLDRARLRIIQEGQASVSKGTQPAEGTNNGSQSVNSTPASISAATTTAYDISRF